MIMAVDIIPEICQNIETLFYQKYKVTKIWIEK